LVNLIQLGPNWVTPFKLITFHCTIGFSLLRVEILILRVRVSLQ